jgi:hypothetical protein
MTASQKFFLELDWNLLENFYGIVDANGVASAANVPLAKAIDTLSRASTARKASRQETISAWTG